MADLKLKAKEIRKLIIETVYNAKAGHLGGPLSCTDILAKLYFDVMNIDPKNPNWEDRDRFVLSKGHASVALYCTMALRGYFPIEELNTFDKINSRLQAHPDMALLPGLDFSTGSLGQGISGAVGMALAAKLNDKKYKVYCLVGDGETQEGQFWEAIDFATRYELDNLIIIVDFNKLQQYGYITSKKTTILSPIHKFKAFGLNTMMIDGHNFTDLDTALRYTILYEKRPTIVLADTIKGKGVSFMENEKLWHSRVPTEKEYTKAMEELS